jgi:peptidoglycan hydrolase-like protein with peptidoglycan-binding domain
VNKASLLISLSVLVVSGCSIWDTQEMEAEKSPVSAAVEREPVDLTTDTPAKETRASTPRILSRDDIRRLQQRLKEIGLDAGPADGVAGARTKAAFVRFQSGCSKIKTLIEPVAAAESHSPNASPAGTRTPSRQETQAMQIQLRDAGFNPGPSDGIFGNRTRSVLVQLKTNCPTVNDFMAILDQASLPVEKQVGRAQATINASNKFQTISSANGREASKMVGVSQRGESPEEIRILQLRLRDAGFDPGPFDGVMGPKTRLALQLYETSQPGKKTKISVTTTGGGQY